MKDLTKIYINLSKLSAEEIIKIEDIIKYEISRINEYPFLIFSFDVWNQCGETSPLLGNKTELTYPEFIKLFEDEDRENDTYIFSYLSCRKTLTVLIKAKNFNKAMIEFATNYHDVEWLHYAKML